MQKIILASNSPQRKKLLETMGISFTVIPSNVDEASESEYSPFERVKLLSSRKAHGITSKVKGPALIIGADTIITDLGEILEKPADKIEATHMLKSLSGRTHTVYTGMTLLFVSENGDIEEENFVDSTDVSMQKISDEEIESYINTAEYVNRAGGYAIQGKASCFVESVNGNFYTVVGLPVSLLYRALKDRGINITEFWS